jgi:hypothetical protein
VLKNGSSSWKGSPHRFKNTGTVTGRFIALCQPAGLMEECVAAVSRMTEADRSNAEKMKAVFAACHGGSVP